MSDSELLKSFNRPHLVIDFMDSDSRVRCVQFMNDRNVADVSIHFKDRTVTRSFCIAAIDHNEAITEAMAFLDRLDYQEVIQRGSDWHAPTMS